MRMAFKYTALTVSIVLSIAIGYGFGVKQATSSSGVAMGIWSAKLFVAESEFIGQIYKQEHNNDLRIKSLEHFVNIIQILPPEFDSLIGEEAKATDLALSYVRLSLLYEAVNEQKSRFYLEKALQIYPAKEGEAVNTEKLITIVRKLDANLEQ